MTADDDRLALAEVECRLAYLDDALTRNASPEHAPRMPSERRTEERRKLESEQLSRRAVQDELAAAVPDPDAVLAPDGTTPPERRARNLDFYIQKRAEDRAKEMAKLEVATRAAEDKTLARDVRTRARTAKQMAQTRIDAIDEEPSDGELTADAMCPDVVHLLSSHAYYCNLARPKWPCGAWPGERQKARDLWRMFDAAADGPRTDLNTWELKLYCGHIVKRTANRCYETYTKATSGLGRPCEVCGVDPAFIVAEQLVADEPAPVRPEQGAPPPLTAAARKRAERRVAKLESELTNLRSTLARPTSP